MLYAYTLATSTTNSKQGEINSSGSVHVQYVMYSH